MPHARDFIKHYHHTALDRLFRYAEFLRFGEVHIKYDHATGLKAIIAIHNLHRGSGIGGCRWLPYKTTDDALQDALRLSYMMSLKAAVSHLPHGGAKAVIIAPKRVKDRNALLRVFAEFVHSLGGRYVTAVDSGTTPEDMNVIAQYTPYVTCKTQEDGSGDPALPTALGVRRGIQAAIKYKLNQDHLDNIHVAIQGAGHVGYHLAKELTELKAQVTMCDINAKALARAVENLGVNTCRPEEIYKIKADVFAPCALGSVLNLKTIKELQVAIVAGSANNQLAHHHHGVMLNELGILYVPDFVINAGGLIYAASMYDHSDPQKAMAEVGAIYNTVMSIFEKAQEKKQTPIEIAEMMAIAELR